MNTLTTESVSLVLIRSSDTGKSNHKTQIHRKWSLISSTAHNLLMAPPVLPSVWFGRRPIGKWAHVFSESPYLSISPGSRCFTGQGAAREGDVQLSIIIQASSLHLVCWHTASHPALLVFARDFTNQKNVAL